MALKLFRTGTFSNNVFVAPAKADRSDIHKYNIKY